MPRHYAISLILFSAVGFGSMAMFVKVAYAAGVNPTMVLALRFLLATAILAPVVWFKRIPLPRMHTVAGFVLMGALYTAQSQSYFIALLHASSSLVGLLLYIYPVLVTLLALLLGWEKPERRTVAVMAVAMAGMAITLGGKLEGELLGIVLGLLAAAIYAIYILLGNRLTKDTHPLAATLVVLTAAAMINSALALSGGAELPRNMTAWLAIGAIALFSTVLAIAAFLAGIKHVGAAQASIISTMEPVVTLALGFTLVDESVSATQLLGGAMVLAAVTLLARSSARKASRNAA